MSKEEKRADIHTAESEKLWDMLLNKEQALKSLRQIYYEGWLNQEIYLKGIQYIEERNRNQDDDILSMGLPTKAYRCLRHSKIWTTGQLRYILTGNVHPQSAKDLFDIRNIGLKGALEIMRIAVEKGVIKKEEIGINCGKRNSSKWTSCRKLLDLPVE